MLWIRLWWFGLLLCWHFLDPRPTNIIILQAEWIAQVGGEEEGKSTKEGAQEDVQQPSPFRPECSVEKQRIFPASELFRANRIGILFEIRGGYPKVG